jgi:hypothetical protein
MSWVPKLENGIINSMGMLGMTPLSHSDITDIISMPVYLLISLTTGGKLHFY